MSSLESEIIDREVEESFRRLREIELEREREKGFEAGRRQGHIDVIEFLERRARDLDGFREIFEGRLKGRYTREANIMRQVAKLLRRMYELEGEGDEN